MEPPPHVPRYYPRPVRLVAPTAPRRAMLPWLVTAVLLGLGYYFRDLVLLAGVAFGMAYLLEPLVEGLARWRLPRAVAIVLVLLTLAAAVTVLLWFVVPDIARDLTDLIATLPHRVRTEWVPRANRGLLYLRQHYRVRVPLTVDAWLSQAGMRASEVAPRSLQVLEGAATASISVLEFALRVVIVMALAFYLLLDYKKLIEGVSALVPRRAEEEFLRIARNVDVALGRFVRGQALVLLVLGTLFSVGLGALGVPGGVGLGILAGLLSVVPYLGFLFALAIALLLAALDGGGGRHVLAVGAYMLVVHILDLTLVTPRILGGSIGLSPVVVILALLAGAKVMGFAGLLLALPVAAVLNVLARELVGYYQRSRWYTVVPAAAHGPHEISMTVIPVEDEMLSHEHHPEDETVPRREPLPGVLANPTARNTFSDGTPGIPEATTTKKETP